TGPTTEVPLPTGIDASIQSIGIASLVISFNEISDTIAARVSHAALKIGTTVDVTAGNEASIQLASLTGAVGGDKTTNFAASVAINLIKDNILADWTAS